MSALRRAYLGTLTLLKCMVTPIRRTIRSAALVIDNRYLDSLLRGLVMSLTTVEEYLVHFYLRLFLQTETNMDKRTTRPVSKRDLTHVEGH